MSCDRSAIFVGETTICRIRPRRAGQSVVGAAADFNATSSAPALVNMQLTPIQPIGARELTFNVTALGTTRAVGRVNVTAGIAGITRLVLPIDVQGERGGNEGGGVACHTRTAAADVDECRLGTHNCHRNATCFNLIGVYRFQCVCNTGWEGTGIVCERTYRRAPFTRSSAHLLTTAPFAAVRAALGPCTFAPCWPGDSVRPPVNCTNLNKGRPFNDSEYQCAPCPATMVGDAVGFFGCKSEWAA